MADFPTLSSAKITACARIPSKASSVCDVSSEQSAPYIVTWSRATRRPKAWNVSLGYLNVSDYDAFCDFMDANGIVGSFSFTEPKTSNTYTVRLSEIPSLTYSAPFWSVSFVVEEV